MPRRTPSPIAVVGASVAGLDFAAEAAARGHEVTVYEQTSALDPVDRTLIVTPRVEEFLGPLVPAVTVNQIDRYELFANGTSCSVTLDRSDLVIERSALIRALAERTRNAGAKIRFGSRFMGLSGHRDGVEIRMDGERPRIVDTVVAADGARSAVARAAGWPDCPTVPLIQAIVQTPSDLPRRTTRVWFRPRESTYFYWLIPEGPHRAVLGVIGNEPRNIRRSLDHFASELGLSVVDYQAARVPEYRRWITPRRAVGAGRVLLVGDAAGHVKVSTVGGIHTGFRGSRAVASGSDRELRSLRRELDRHRRIRRVLDRFSEEDYSALLAMLSPTSRGVLARRTRDEAGRLLPDLLVRQPGLALLASRSFFRRGRPSALTPDISALERLPN